MNVEECISKRKSVRTYKPEKISQELLEKILQAGILSPSAKNQQPWKYIVVSEEIKNQIAEELTKNMGHPNPTSRAISECSHLILVYNTQEEYFSHMSIGASIENILLTATSYGLGSLWIGYIRKITDYVNSLTNEENELISAIALGYPNEEPPARPRKDFSEVVSYLK